MTISEVNKMTLLVKRIEVDEDDKGRRVVHETEVMHVNLWGNPFQDVVDEDYEENDGDNIDNDEVVGESGHQYEVTGELILKFIDKMEASGTPIRECWKEDGIGRDGEPFNVENRYYTVEVF